MRSPCNGWDVKALCLWKRQAICLLLFSVTRKISALQSDKGSLQPRTDHTRSQQQLLPAQVTCTWVSPESSLFRITRPLFLENGVQWGFPAHTFQVTSRNSNFSIVRMESYQAINLACAHHLHSRRDCWPIFAAEGWTKAGFISCLLSGLSWWWATTFQRKRCERSGRVWPQGLCLRSSSQMALCGLQDLCPMRPIGKVVLVTSQCLSLDASPNLASSFHLSTPLK